MYYVTSIIYVHLSPQQLLFLLNNIQYLKLLKIITVNYFHHS